MLTAKGKTVADGMTADGDATFVSLYTPDITETDTTTYATDSYSGAQVTNQFDDAKGDITYLTRSDWTGTFPQHDGEPSDIVSTWGGEINGDEAWPAPGKRPPAANCWPSWIPLNPAIPPTLPPLRMNPSTAPTMA